jgi:hypothetical protein
MHIVQYTPDVLPPMVLEVLCVVHQLLEVMYH